MINLSVANELEHLELSTEFKLLLTILIITTVKSIIKYLNRLKYHLEKDMDI